MTRRGQKYSWSARQFNESLKQTTRRNAIDLLKVSDTRFLLSGTSWVFFFLLRLIGAMAEHREQDNSGKQTTHALFMYPRDYFFNSIRNISKSHRVYFHFNVPAELFLLFACVNNEDDTKNQSGILFACSLDISLYWIYFISSAAVWRFANGVIEKLFCFTVCWAEKLSEVFVILLRCNSKLHL